MMIWVYIFVAVGSTCRAGACPAVFAGSYRCHLWSGSLVARSRRLKLGSFVDSIPKSPAGKILRRQLTNHVQAGAVILLYLLACVHETEIVCKENQSTIFELKE